MFVLISSNSLFLVCMPFLDWDPNCWKVWGYWIGCPVTNPCFSMMTDVICLAECGLRKLATAFVLWTKKNVLKVGFMPYVYDSVVG